MPETGHQRERHRVCDVAADDVRGSKSRIQKEERGDTQRAGAHRRQRHQHAQHESDRDGEGADLRRAQRVGGRAPPALQTILAEDRKRRQDQRDAQRLGDDFRERGVIDLNGTETAIVSSAPEMLPAASRATISHRT